MKNYIFKFVMKWPAAGRFNCPQTVFAIAKIFFFAALVLVVDGAQDEECSYWVNLCESIGSGIEHKKCINGQTIFYLSPVKSRWTMARFYCQSIFNGYQNADLLYLDNKNNLEDFRSFISKLPPQSIANSEYSTSALCCSHIQTDSIRAKKCLWPNKREPVTNLDGSNFEKALENSNLNNRECSFLKVMVDQKMNIDFNTDVETISSTAEFPFICSYSRPVGCTDPVKTTTTTTTRRPPTTTRPTVPVRTTDSTMATELTDTTITTITTTEDSRTISTTTTIDPTPDSIVKCTIPDGTYGIAHWPPVLPGESSIAQCPTGTTGTATWNCEMDGKFSSTGPTITCAHHWINDLKKDVSNTTNISQLETKVDELHNELQEPNKKLKYHGDLDQMLSVVQEIRVKTDDFVQESTTAAERASVKRITNSVIRSCTHILANTEAWNNGNKNNTVHYAGQVLKYVQYAGVTYGCTQMNGNPANSHLNLTMIAEESRSVNIYMNAFDMMNEQPIRFGYGSGRFALTDSIDNGTVVSAECAHQIGIGSVIGKISQYLSSNMPQAEQYSINSEIIAFNYNNKSTTYDLPRNTYAKMTLQHHQKLKFGVKPRCVYWDIGNNAWSSRGCWIDDAASSIEQSVCVCNHLTSFSVLMDVSGREEPSTAKNVLTIVSTSASVIALIVTIAIFSICRELKNRRTTILINLSVSLIFVDLLVLFGLDRVEYSILCKGVSILLLYWLFASFSWMLMEGYQLYQMVILVFNNIGHLRLQYLYMIGYGVPAIMTIIAATVLLLNNGLINEHFCWISSSRHPLQILALIIPATIVIIINTVIMYLVLRTAFKMKYSKRAKKSGTPSSSNIQSMPTGGDDISSGSSGSTDTITQRQRNMLISENAINPNGLSVNSKRQLIEKYNQNGTVAVSFVDTTTITTTTTEGNSQSNNGSTQNGNQNNKKNDDPTTSGGKKLSPQWISYVKGYVSLIVLMGITWITYVLYIHEFGHFFSYIFIVLNGLQGVFIFLTQFLLDKKVYNAVRKRLRAIFGQVPFYSSSANTATTTNIKNMWSSSFASTSTSEDKAAAAAVAKNGRSNEQRKSPTGSSISSASSSSSSSTANRSDEMMIKHHRNHSPPQRQHSLEYF